MRFDHEGRGPYYCRMTLRSNETWPLNARLESALLRYFRRLFQADGARLTAPLGGRIFLVIGKKRNTRDDPGQWVNEKGEICHWDYLSETCIASGSNLEELVSSAKHYKTLEGKKVWDFLTTAKA